MNNSLPTERSFGLSVGAVCAAAGAFSWWRGHLLTAEVLASIGAMLLLAGASASAALRIPNRLWWRFAQALGWVNSRVLLTVFFIVVLTPVGAVMRLFGRNPLRGLPGGTNWSPYAARHRDPRHYEHLF
jgi:hypothetical protein